MSAFDPEAVTGLQSTLARDARALRAGQRCPIDLAPIIRQLGLGLQRRPAADIGGEGALLRGSRGWTVVIAATDFDHPRTRFTIAHEIGHYLLAGYGVPVPSTRGDYWRTEALCHHFAGQLLIPDSAVDWVGAGAPGGALELLRRSIETSRRALVSPAALSHRLNQELEYCAFCEVRLASPRQGVVGVVDWILERFRWLGVGPRRHIKRDHFLAGLLDGQRQVLPDRVTSGYLNGLPTAALRRVGSVWMLGVEPALASASLSQSDQLSFWPN